MLFKRYHAQFDRRPRIPNYRLFCVSSIVSQEFHLERAIHVKSLESTEIDHLRHGRYVWGTTLKFDYLAETTMQSITEIIRFPNQ